MAEAKPFQLQSGQSLEDIANALIGAESDLAERGNLPSTKPRVQPPDVELPSFQQILAQNFPNLLATPGAGRQPKTKFGTAMNIIGSFLVGGDPVLRKEALLKQKMENDLRHDQFQTAISLYQADMRRSDLLQQKMDDRTRILNEDIVDFNKRLDAIKEHPKAWDILKESINILQTGASEAGRAARESKQEMSELKGKTRVAIGDFDKLLNVIDNGGLGKLSMLLGGKQPKRDLDDTDPDDRKTIAKIINNPGTLARMKASGADLNEVYDYLSGKYGAEGENTPDGPGLVPPRDKWLRGVNPTPKVKEKAGTVSSAPPKFKPEIFDTTDKESKTDYVNRIAKETGDINLAYAYTVVNKYGAATPEEVEEQLNEPVVKDRLEGPEVGASIQQIVDYVRQLLTNPKATPKKAK